MSRDTRIKKGQHLSPSTQFQPGQHWRKPKPHWDREWLWNEYIEKGKSAEEIGRSTGCTSNAICFWLQKHSIPRRTTVEVRAIKHWGCSGADNPMFLRRGILSPQWKGGLTPLRQKIYARSEWRQMAKAVFKRDKHTCQLCGRKEKLEIHHIDPFSQAPLLVLDIGNVILLCDKCHDKMAGQEKRWKKKLFKLIERG